MITTIGLEGVELERPKFEAALRASDKSGTLAMDFSRHVVDRGYAGYINQGMESAFFGWMLAGGGKARHIVTWLRAQANAEQNEAARKAFIEAHNAALAIYEERV